jgi:hypothetical protein
MERANRIMRQRFEALGPTIVLQIDSEGEVFAPVTAELALRRRIMKEHNRNFVKPLALRTLTLGLEP